MNFPKDDVIVIGAGMAGLSCGLSLSEMGLRCRILEARERPGGRVQSRMVNGKVIELGGEFIHGQHVSTWRYLKRYGMSACGRGNSRTPDTDVMDDGDIYVFKNGELLPPKHVHSEPNCKFFDPVEDCVADFLNQGGDPSISFGELILRKEQQVFSRPPTEEEKLLCHGMLAEWYAADLDDLALIEDNPVAELLEAAQKEPSLLQDDGSEGHWRVAQGYSQLAERMAADVNVSYETPVVNVNWGGDVVTATAVNSRGETSIFKADRVVVAVPLACLQHRQIAFQPPLPDEKQQAIEQLGCGFAFKVLLRFPETFWPEDLQFLYTPFSLHIWWPGPVGSNVLIAYAGGATAVAAVLTGRSDDEVIELAASQLGRIFKGMPRHVGGEVIRWPEDQYSLMGYSYAKAGSPEKARLDMRAQTSSGSSTRLYWAGEACHPTKSSTVHGAIESGEHTARDIAKCLDFELIDLRDYSALLPKAYAELLVPNFPCHGELDDLETMESGLAGGDDRDDREPELHILVLRDGDALAGLVHYEYYPRCSVCLLSYIVISPAHKGRGLASRLVRAMEAQLRQRCKGAPVAAIVAETHSISTEDGIMNPRERQDVLAHLGFRCLQFQYTQPPLKSFEEPPTGLRLLIKEKDKVDPNVIIQWLDDFAGSVNEWDESRWKNAGWYVSQVADLKAVQFVPSVAERPW